MRRRLLLFCVTAELVLTAGILYRWGGGLVCALGENLSVQFYSGVLHVYVPDVVYAGEEGFAGICQDAAASLSPVLAQSGQMQEERTDGQTSREALAARENEAARQILAENEQAQDENVQETESTQTSEAEDATADTQTEAKTDAQGEKKQTINRKKLQDFDYLLRTFYQVDNTTTIGKDQLNAEALLEPDLTVDLETDGPQILLYHTHSQECYADSKQGDPKTSVVGVGDYLTKLLEKKGFTVLHHKGEYDVGDRDHAYSNAAPAIEQLLSDNPTIQVVIDLHRDGVSENTRLVTEQNGKKMAKVMFFNGLSRTTAAGDIAYLKNPYIADNLAFSFQMQLAAMEYYPDYTRRIYLKGYRFNMHFCPKSMLVEVGAQTNTFEEAKNAMEPLADLLAKVLQGEETDD